MDVNESNEDGDNASDAGKATQSGKVIYQLPKGARTVVAISVGFCAILAGLVIWSLIGTYRVWGFAGGFTRLLVGFIPVLVILLMIIRFFLRSYQHLDIYNDRFIINRTSYKHKDMVSLEIKPFLEFAVARDTRYHRHAMTTETRYAFIFTVDDGTGERKYLIKIRDSEAYARARAAEIKQILPHIQTHVH